MVLETGPQPSPSTAIFAPTPQKLPSRRTCANCGVGRQGLNPQSLQPSPPSGIAEQLRLQPLPPVLTQCCSHLAAPAPRTSLACVRCLLPSVHLPPFCLAFAFCWGESPSSQLPSHYLLTLRWKVSKLQEQDENSLLPSSTFRMGTWECETFLAAYNILLSPAQGLTGQECDLSYIYIYPSKTALPCIPHQKEDGGYGLTLA